jgi:hypothetical protein
LLFANCVDRNHQILIRKVGVSGTPAKSSQKGSPKHAAPCVGVDSKPVRVKGAPSSQPSMMPSDVPSLSISPSSQPSEGPSAVPSTTPSVSTQPSQSPSKAPVPFACNVNYMEDDITIKMSGSFDCSTNGTVILSGADQTLECDGPEFPLVDMDGSQFTVILAGGSTIRNCFIMSTALDAAILIDESQVAAGTTSTGVFTLDTVFVVGGASLGDGLEGRTFTSPNVTLNIMNSGFILSNNGIYIADPVNTNQLALNLNTVGANSNLNAGILIGDASVNKLQVDMSLIALNVVNNVNTGLDNELINSTITVSNSFFCGNGVDTFNDGTIVSPQTGNTCDGKTGSMPITCDNICTRR